MARRKKRYAGELFTVKRTLQLTPAQDAEMTAAAEGQGATWSDFARELMFRRLGLPGIVSGTRRDPARDALFAALHAAAVEHAANGNNLNQIARHVNMTGDVLNWGDLREAVALFTKAEKLYVAALERVFVS